MHITLPALLLVLTSLSTVSALPANPSANKKYPYFVSLPPSPPPCHPP